MSDSLQYEQSRQLIDDARQCEKEQQYTEAAQFYKQAYDLDHNEFAGSRYLYCLRKSKTEGSVRAAVDFGRSHKDLLRNNEHARRAYAWALYDCYLKGIKEDAEEEAEEFDEPGVRAGDATTTFHTRKDIARIILKLTPTTDFSPRKLTVFAMCREAKRFQKWAYVEEFARQLDGQTLSLESEAYNGRQLPSDYQRWAFSLTRALLEMERYEECIIQAREACEKLSENERFHFHRWEALAQIRMGQSEEGLKQLEYINSRYPKQWYVQSDIAHVLVQSGRSEEALLWFCRAMSMPGDLKGRIGTLKALCEVLQQLERWQSVYEHVCLAWVIELEQRSKHAEKTEQQLYEFQSLHADQLNIPSNTKVPSWSSALRPCRETWQATIRLAQPTHQGRISTLHEDRRFGFISNENGRFHFKFSTFKGKPELNAWVQFEIEDQFDAKQNRMSKTAVNVRPTKAPEQGA